MRACPMQLFARVAANVTMHHRSVEKGRSLKAKQNPRCRDQQLLPERMLRWRSRLYQESSRGRRAMKESLQEMQEGNTPFSDDGEMRCVKK